MFKKSLVGIVLFLALLIPTQSFADANATKEVKDAKKETQSISKDRVEAAKELLKEMNLKSVYENAVNNSTIRLIKADPKFKKVEDKIKAFYNKYIGWNSMQDDLAKLYAKYYTSDELKDITAFYKTKTGKKVLASMGRLSYEGQMITRKKLQPHIDELKAILDKAAKDNKKAPKQEKK